MTREELIRLTREYAEQGYFPSAAVSIFDGQNTLCRFTIGDAKEESLFDLASLTKIATATLVLQMAEQGRLSLDSPVAPLLPELEQDDFLEQRLRGVTLRRLLTHTGGLPAWYPFYTAPDWVTALRLALKRPPEQGVVYSDIGFILLGKALKAVHGQPLADCLQERLVRPLGLGAFGYLPESGADVLPSGWGNPSEVQMCRDMGLQFDGWRPDAPIVGQVHDGNAWYAFEGVSGHAGIFANLNGVQRLAQHHLTTRSPLLVDAMQEHAPGRGLGWEVGEMYPDGCGHTGFTGTSIYISRSLQVGCVILSNRCFYREQGYRLTNPYRRAMHRIAAEHFGTRRKEDAS